MKVNVSIRTIALSAALFVGSLTVSAHNNDRNLIYNSEEKDGVMVEQTVYKKEGAALANYMKYNYKYNDQKRMTESEALKWNASSQKWENSLRITYTYEGKTVTTNYYKWNSKKNSYILVPEMTVTMDDTNI
ncbi:DUF3836 domain-containing protein [Bacteroides sp. K03]|uniref:DUF3836 domain-containing protein n=1 Tax=Bacteroides TaxID=816 RepID=UPI001C8C1DA5|nr:DUF3836 domain-containing protein [Bacteroides sp. K03]MBX9186632.1 DUF3836 domain-containing protein [Bacteroides sp. K03]